MPDSRIYLGAGAFLGGCLITAIALQTDWLQQVFTLPARADADLYAPRDWSQGAASTLNISSFAFADRDRSHGYTPRDRPMAGVALRLTRPDGSTLIGRSNVNGFINFAMQLNGDEGDITEVGKTYRFELIAPPGWEITTDTAVHETAFREIAGAIAGMGAVDPPPVVGLAPRPSVTGHWPAAAGSSLRARGPDGKERSIRVDPQGRFADVLTPGAWSLSDAAGAVRQIDLGFAPVHVGVGARMATGTGTAVAARTIDFDDNERSPIEKLAPGYAGLGWDYLLAVDHQYYKGPGYVNGLVSGSMVAYNSSGHPVTIFATAPDRRFDFLGGFFSAAWPQAEGETLTVRAYRDDALVAEDRLTLSHLGPVFFQADYADVSRVVFTTEHYWQFVVDDLQMRRR